MRIRRNLAGAATAMAIAGALVLATAPSAWAAPPSNDNIADAIVLQPGTTSIAGTTVDATSEPGEEVPTPRATVWYTWTSPVTGEVSIDTCGSGGYDTILRIMPAGQLSGAIEFDDDGCGFPDSLATFPATEGTSYSIQVSGFAGAQGTFVLNYPAPAASGPTKDLTVWYQSFGRTSVEVICIEGWAPSWEQWPNDGAGGYVCSRGVYAYYPDEPVR